MSRVSRVPSKKWLRFARHPSYVTVEVVQRWDEFQPAELAYSTVVEPETADAIEAAWRIGGRVDFARCGHLLGECYDEACKRECHA